MRSWRRSDATGDGRPRPHGIEPHATPDAERSRGRRVRRERRLGQAARERGCDRHRFTRGLRERALEASRCVGHGPRRVRRADDRSARRADGVRRHRDRRRELVLPRRHGTSRAVRREGHALRGRRNERWCVRARAGILPDDRRRDRGREASRSDLQGARARGGRRASNARTHRRERDDLRAGVSALRSCGCRAFREDGPQRDRVRADGIVRRGVERAEARERRSRDARVGRRDDAAPRSAVLPVRPEHLGDHGGVAARKCGRVVAARPHGSRDVRGPNARGLLGSSVGLGRGTVDRTRRGRRGRSRPRAFRGAVRSVRVTPRSGLREQGALGVAPAVRRARRDGGIVRVTHSPRSIGWTPVIADGARDLARAVRDLADRLPERLWPLARVAYNYRWSWAPGGEELFRRIDPVRFERARGNPVSFLFHLPTDVLERVAHDHEVVSTAERLQRACDGELAAPSISRGEVTSERPVAFVCAEFGIHRSLPIYQGGLGVLAGDILKGSSDLRIPMVGVGLLYSKGSFHQRIDQTGWQHDYWLETEPDRLPAALIANDDGTPLVVDVPVSGRTVHVQVWRVQVGRVPLFLLDANREDNGTAERWITARLYVGNPVVRLQQYAMLGVGGIRVLRAIRNARERTIFTTHTPVAAGNETYEPTAVLEVLGPLIDAKRLTDFGSVDGGGIGMTSLGLRLARASTAVSRRHGEVARAMWRPLFASAKRDEDVPITHVTNGVHVPTWMAGPMRELLDRHLGDEWHAREDDPATWASIESIPDQELWATRSRLRAALADYIRKADAASRLGRYEDASAVEDSERAFLPDRLTLGFARRVATYKRLHLLLRDHDRIETLLGKADSIQFVIAGKAHPRDSEAKESLAEFIQTPWAPDVAPRIAFIEDYDMDVASHLVAGCDVWVNVPRPPLEASGTSGMKAALNGALNLSVLDGWWAEAYDGENGWAVGDAHPNGDDGTQDDRDAEDLLDKIEHVLLPMFHSRNEAGVPVEWVRRVKRSLMTVGPRFGATRMLREYLEWIYAPEG